MIFANRSGLDVQFPRQPDGTSVTNTYHATGERQRTSGSGTYPVEYTYDHAGRMKTLKTWRNFASDTGAALTTWNYSATRGFLLSKQYADGQGPSYTYTAAGRLATRTWARGLTTYYAYNNAGDLAAVNYDDNQTAGFSHTYDRRGRRAATTTTAGTTITTTYHPAGPLTSESFTAGPLDGLSVTNGYDSLRRRSSLAALPPSSFLLHTFGYDSASRLATVSDGTNSATYTYLANSPLVSQIAFIQSGQPRMTTTKQYDALNRLTSIASGASNSNSALSSFSYDYNSANQRTRTTTADGSYWIYQYDTLGQVISGKRFWPDGTPVAGQQFEYGFDDIGNRQSAAHGGNAGGSNLRLETYTANDLNQYTQRTVPGFAEVQGRARSDATVTVNLQPTTRQGTYWRSELMTDNSASRVWLGVTNVAVLRGAGAGGTDLVASNTGTLFLPQTPETFTHDADGNLTRDGRWTNSWDAENRLIRTESLASTPASSRVRQDWTHLPDGRWAQRIIYSWIDNDWVPQATNRFLWDDKVLLAVLNGNNQAEQTYLRGLDLSGTPQGAGGVGGLLAVNLGTNGTHFACFDGNGNVSALLSANSSTLTATYEYDPFGNTLRATGPAAAANSLRFSTQFADDVTDRVKYLYRDYDAGVGRWLSRDLVSEAGGLNLYRILGNDLVSHVDLYGLVDVQFYIVTGIFSVFSDKYSNPPAYGEGAEATDGATYAKSRILIHSGNFSGNGTCNSIYTPNSRSANAGEIQVAFTPECVGRYRVYFAVNLELSSDGPIGQATGTLEALGSPFIQYFNETVSSNPSNPLPRSKSYRRTIHVDFTVTGTLEKREILKWKPTVSMPPHLPAWDSFGEGKAEIRYLSTKRNGRTIDPAP